MGANAAAIDKSIAIGIVSSNPVSIAQVTASWVLSNADVA